MAEISAMRSEPLRHRNIEARTNRNPEQVIAAAEQQMRAYDAEYDQGHIIAVDYDVLYDLVELATLLRTAAPDA